MALTDKDILITPNDGSASANPKIEFTGADANGNDTITVDTQYDGSITTLSYEGSAGQLFSISNDLSGTIFSVNDNSGIPSIEVDNDGEIRLAEFSGNVGIGVSAPGEKLHVKGTKIRLDGTQFELRDSSGNFKAALKDDGSQTTLFADGGGSYPYLTFNGSDVIIGDGTSGQAKALQLFVGSADVATDNTGLTFTMDGTYSDGRYEHRFRKRDEGGGIPLYIDKTDSTANSHTALVRFGGYTNNTEPFEVYGNAKVDELIVTDFVKATGNNLKFSAGGTHVLNIDVNGKIYPNTHNAYDIGFNSSTAFRNAYFSGTGNFANINTGQGATEVHLMNQNVRTSDSPTFQDLTVQGNLSITGDINSYNVTDLDVTDKTITVGSGQTEANSGGSGLIVDGSGASLLWDEADNYWAINKKLAFDSTPTTTNQGLGIIWTGFDKEGTTDPSDSASIYHTTNTGGHGGSVLLISSMNDSGDGIAFSTHGSSYLKHNSSEIITAGNYSTFITSVSNADTVDSLHAASFLRSDANDTATGALTFSNSANHFNGHIYYDAYDANGNHYPHYLSGSSNNGAQVNLRVQQSGGTGYDVLYIPNGSNNITWRGNTFWNAGNDGSGSGLDADLLDGINGASYLRSDADDTLTGNLQIDSHVINMNLNNINDNAIDLTSVRSSTWPFEFTTYSVGNDNSSGFWVGSNGYPDMRLRRENSTVRALISSWETSYVSNGFNINGNTAWHAGNDGPGSGLDADTLDGYHKSDINPAHSHYRWTNISASSAQARRFVIMRLYGCPAHWDSNWQDIHLKVWSESYEATNLKYQLTGDYGGAGTQANMFQLRLKDAGGSSEHNRFRLVLGTPVDAGWDHAGQDTYYVDVYAEASHYMNFTVAADFYSAGFNVNTLPTSGGATSVVYSSPTVSNITTFNEAKEHSYFANHKIWNDGNDGSASGLDADLLDGQHGSYYYAASNPNGYTSNVGDITGVTAGNGLTGGGSSGTPTLNVGSGSGISVAADTVGVDSSVIRTTGAQSMSGVKTHTSRLALSSGQMLSLGDTNHHLVKVTTGYSGATVDGPRLQGHQGGELATNIGSNQYSLRWDNSGNITVRNNVNVLNDIVVGTYSTTNSGNLYLTGYTANKQAVLKCTNGNLHMDGNAGNAMYLNYYTGSGIYFGTGAGGVGAVMGPDGDLWKGSSDNSGSKYWHAGNDGSGSGLDADTVDGKHKDFLMHYKGQVSGNWDTMFSQTDGHMGVYQVSNITNTDSNYPSGAYTYGGVMSWQLDDSTFKLYAPHTGQLHYQTGWNNDEYSGWRKIWDTGNDGSGSGLDADTVDGQHASAFLTAETLSSTNAVTVTGTKYWQPAGTATSPLGGGGGASLQAYTTGTTAAYMAFHRSGAYAINWGLDTSNTMVLGGWSSSTTAARMSIGTNGLMVTAGQGNLWGSSNDGSGSGLDADLLDGQHGSYYAQASHNHNGVYTPYDHFSHTGHGNYTSTTTSALLTEALGDNAFDSKLTAHKTSWSYAGNGDLTDAGRLTELAGTSWLWWTDNSADNVQGYITGLCIAPTTGGSAGKMFVYNNQSSGYSPGWREIWTSTSDGSGSGLDADLLDGQQGSYYAPASHNHSGVYLPISGKAADSELLDGIDSTRVIYGSGASGTTNANPTVTSSPYQKSGFYDVHGSSNNAPTNTYYSYINMRHTNTANNHGHQIAGSFYSQGDLYNRHINNNSYGSWSKIWNATNDGSGSGLDADLLDGQHGSYYAPASSIPSVGNGTLTINTAGSVSGSGTFTANQSGNATITITGATIPTSLPANGGNADTVDGKHATDLLHYRGIVSGDWDTIFTTGTGKTNTSGLYQVQNLASGHSNHPTGVYTYGGVLAWQLANSTFKLYSSHTGDLAFQSGWSNDEYSGWRRILTSSYYGAAWTSANDGSGSGLDADLLDGQHGSYYYSAANPPPTYSKYLRSDVDDSFSGALTSTARNNGIFGSYDSTKTDHIWSIGTGYKNHSAGTNFGNLYGLAYKHTNNTTGGTMGGGHQMVWCNNGTPRAAIGYDRFWHAASGTMWGSSNDGSGSGLDADLLDGQHGSYYYSAANPAPNQTITLSGAVTGSGTTSITTSNPYQTSVAFSTNGPDGVMEYQQAASITDTKLAPTADWYNSIRMGHGDPYSYYSNTMAMKMTGGGSGTLYTQVISNNSAGGWNKYWHTNNDGSGSGLDADLLDGQHGSYYAPASHNHNGVYTPYDHFSHTGHGNYASTTTSALLTEALGDNAFDSKLTAHKTSWSYAGNGDLTDAGRLTELAGTSWLWWTDNSTDNVQGYITGLAIAPNTGGSAGKMFVYNNQGASYGPGWREIWTSTSDGSGSGLDADTCDGQHLGSTAFVRFGGVEYYNGTSSNINVRIAGTGDSSAKMYWKKAGTTNLLTLDMSGNLTATGNVTAYSDRRIKENITPITEALSKVQRLTGNTYTRNDQEDTATKYAGLIAQEVEDVLPEAVREADDGIKALDYNATIALLVESIKELKAEVDDLKTQLETK